MRAGRFVAPRYLRSIVEWTAMLPDHFPFLLDHCLAGLYVLSGDRIVWINATAAGMIGWKPEE